MSTPQVIAIHGVGVHLAGTIEGHIKDTLTRANVEAGVTEFNWDKISPHFQNVDDGIGNFLRQASRCVFAATRLGFAPPHRYPLPAVLRGVDSVCSFLAVASSSLACTLALIFPFTAVLYLLVFSIYAELSWHDFAFATRPATSVVVGLVAVALASTSFAIVVATLATPICGTWVLCVFVRRYVLLILSRVLVVVTAPLRLPLKEVFAVFAPFAVIYFVFALFPFSYNGFFFSERLAKARLPLKLGIGLLAGWAGALTVTWLLSKWISGPLEVILDIARYLCDPTCRSSVQEALDDAVRSIGPDKRVVLLAHSLGSVIALDSLVNSTVWQGHDEVVLITLGSPIRRAFVRFFPRFLFPGGVLDAGRLAQTRVHRLWWINAYRRLDFVGTKLGLVPDVGIDVPTGQWGGHAGYWKDDKVLYSLVEAFRDQPATTTPQLPSRREVWIPYDERQPPPVIHRTVRIAQALLFVISLLGAFWVPNKALRVRDASLDATVANVLERGRTYFARVTHRENPEAGSNENEYYYTDEFVFEYRDELGVGHRHEEHVDSWIVSPKSLRRFDNQQLREYVRKHGKLVGPTKWYKSNTTVPAQVENIPIMVLASAPECVVVLGFRSVGRGSAMDIVMRLFWVALGIAGACSTLFSIFVGQTAGSLKD